MSCLSAEAERVTFERVVRLAFLVAFVLLLLGTRAQLHDVVDLVDDLLGNGCQALEVVVTKVAGVARHEAKREFSCKFTPKTKQ